MKTTLKFVGLGAIVLGLASNLSFARSAKAGLEFCNRSAQGRVYVAVAYPIAKNNWKTQGWLTLDEGKCGTLIEGKLSNRYYYYYAETDKDYTWAGTHSFCVSQQKFTFANAEKQCKGINSRWAKFRQLDTGRNAVDFRLNLE